MISSRNTARTNASDWICFRLRNLRQQCAAGGSDNYFFAASRTASLAPPTAF
jgi:hypothetical protein